MRFALDYHIKPGELPLDYRPLLVSLLYSSLEKYDPQLAWDWYYTKRPKPFTFAVVMGRRLPEKSIFSPAIRKIQIGPRFVWQFSAAHPVEGTKLYNALVQNAREVNLSDNVLKLQRIRPLMEPVIVGKTTIFETLSPTPKTLGNAGFGDF